MGVIAQMPQYSIERMHGSQASIMGKLFNLKKWLTVADAARYLSAVFDEDVTEADVLRLALDGYLRLSVHFVNGTHARCGNVVPWKETKWVLGPPLGERAASVKTLVEDGTFGELPEALATLLQETPKDEWEKCSPLCMNLLLGEGQYLNLNEKISTLWDVWDLLMIGGERLDIEHAYQRLTGGPAITAETIDGAFVVGSTGQICQLQKDYDDNEYQAGSSAQLESLKQYIVENNIGSEEAERLLEKHKEARKKFLGKRETQPIKEHFFPAGGLPKDSVIVVRKESLVKFEQSVSGTSSSSEKPLTTRERNSLLIIIAALCDYSDIKYQERGAAMQITKLTEDIGASVSDDTVRRALAQISDALESRRK